MSFDFDKINDDAFKRLSDTFSLERVRIVIDDNQPVSKGTFAKFTDILNKYPDIINSAGSLILKWLSSTN